MKMGLSFVNIHGQVVDVTPVKTKREPKTKEAHHDGWLATGVSPQAVAEGQRLTIGFGKEFDLQAFLRNAKREKIRTKPYFSASAAKDACELAEKAGWHACYPQEKKVD
jgi:hypothetical protein